jgi:hypothetical protein
MRRALLAAAGLWLTACSDAHHDAKVPGEPIGRFAITGKLERDECEAAVLGIVDPWTFELRLSRFARDLYWLNGREAISGALSGDERSFTFDTRIDVELEPARSVRRPGCTLTRRDVAEGALSPNAGAATRVSASLQFVYDIADGSDCSNIVGVSGGFSRLPCRVEFELSGPRLEESAD